MSSGSSNLSFAKTRSVLYGGGGSGEPITFDVVHGTRLSMPDCFRGGWAVAFTFMNTRNDAKPKDERTRTLARRMGAHLLKVGSDTGLLWRSRGMIAIVNRRSAAGLPVRAR